MSESIYPRSNPVAEVAALTGGLAVDEEAVVYGALLAGGLTSSPGTADALVPAFQIQSLATAVLDLRSRPCPYCLRGVTDHALDFGGSGLEVRCLVDGAARPLSIWRAGPPSVPVSGTLLAVVLWVGIPLVTLGLAGFVMPAVAGFARKNRRWKVAAGLWLAVIAAESVLVSAIPTGEQPAAVGFVALGVWIGSTAYGAVQIKPWLEPQPS